MGCDIHLVVQRKRLDGTWETVRELDPVTAWAGARELRYESRNYDVFAMLASVRNGRGFAGCKTGDGFVPIAEPRGLPADFTPPTDPEGGETMWMGDHSFSYVGLDELLAYDWEQVVTQYGVVGAEQFLQLDKEGKKPDSYCGGVGGALQFTLTAEAARVAMPELLPQLKEKAENVAKFPGWAGLQLPMFHVEMSWKETYREAAWGFYKDFVPLLVALADGKPDSVRIVFGFDS